MAMKLKIVVVGAGLVGLCAALSLQERGHNVVLVDRDEPLGKASRWNAGVLATSSLWPMVNPGLPRQAVGLALARFPGFRLNRASLRSALPFTLRALRDSRRAGFDGRVGAIDRLISFSRGRHEALMAESGCAALRTDNGWLHLYESSAALRMAQPQLDAFAQNGVGFKTLGRNELTDLEPHLAPRFERAVLLTGSAWVREPSELGAAYLALFKSRGGHVRNGEVTGMEPDSASLSLTGGERLRAERLVLAAGPWTAALLASAGLRLPMIGERGYVRRVRPSGNAGLNRPVFDTAGGIVLAPRPDGVQISTGTELCSTDAPRRTGQAKAALDRARLLLPLGEEIGELQAAERPTLPDGLPAIGPLKAAPQVWLATGHQHIGFSTSAGTGELVADGLGGKALPDWAAEFSPARFGL